MNPQLKLHTHIDALRIIIDLETDKNIIAEFKRDYLYCYSVVDIVEFFKITQDELIILKLKYNDNDLKEYIFDNYVAI